MDPIRIFSIISWILLPTVMFGGYFLLHLQVRNNVLTPFKETYFRAGHAHAGTLLLLSLLYYQYLGQHTATFLFRWIASIVALLALLAISGGFFLHMVQGEPGSSSAGVLVTNIGAALLTLAILFLVYLIIVG
jgi:hypothetical protein